MKSDPADTPPDSSDASIDRNRTQVGIAPSQIGPYRIDAQIGQGGMGQVFRATDTRLNRTVAIKTSLTPFDGRFMREARAASALNHPHICTVYDIGEWDGRSFIVMEYLDGEPLNDLIARGPLPIAQVIALTDQIADALEAAHGANIIHRDIKPANILVTRRGQAKVLDFGLAKETHQGDAAGNGLTATGLVVGTADYMSPEQATGRHLDPRTDLFSLGVVVYEMSTGRWPFRGDSVAATLGAILHKEPADPRALNPMLPAGLGQVIARCLKKDREERYQNAHEIRQAIAAVRSGSGAAEGTAARRPSRFRRPYVIAATGVVAAALTGVGAFVWRQAVAPTEPGSIVLADFENTTGDAAFDGTLSAALAENLSESPFLRILPDARIQQALKMMEQTQDVRRTPAITREICQRTDSAASLEGSIASLGAYYLLHLNAIGCTNGETLARLQGEAADKEQVIQTLGQLAQQMRTQLGESVASVNAHHTPLEEATTRSLDALKVYTTALNANLTKGGAAAIPLYKRAIELDPEFGAAYARLGLAYSGNGQAQLAREVTAKAYALRDRMIEPERYLVSFLYERQVTGNLEKALRTLQAWTESYPREYQAHGLTGGFSTEGTGRFELSIAAARRSMELRPDASIFPYGQLGLSYLALDRFPEVEKILGQAHEKNLDSPDLNLIRFLYAFEKGDQTEVDNAVEQSRGKPRAEEVLALAKGLAEASGGRLAAAAERLKHAADISAANDAAESAACILAAIAMIDVFYDQPAANVRDATSAALELSTNGRDVSFAVAFPLAMIGDIARAESFADDLDRRFPEDTSVRATYLPVLRGLIALQRGNPEDAIKILRPTIATELYLPGLAFDSLYGRMLTTYVRGLALKALHKPSEAAAEFQRIVAHRGFVGVDPVGSIALLELARAQRDAGATADAKKTYQVLLARWGGADSGLALVDKAKAALGELP